MKVLIMVGGTLAVLAGVFILAAVVILISPFISYYGSAAIDWVFYMDDRWHEFVYDMLDRRKTDDDE